MKSNIFAPLFTCLTVFIGACRQKEEHIPTESTEDVGRRNGSRVEPHAKTPISEYQKKRIRSTIQSAGKLENEENRVEEFVELLQSFPSDNDVLHALALETSSTSSGSQEALAKAVVRMYRAGEYGKLGGAVDALKTDGTLAGILVHRFAQDLRAQSDLVVRAFEELLVDPPKNVKPYHYEDIASGAARELGYPEALAMIPNLHDGAFGTTAAKEIITNWTFKDPQAVSIYVRDLPDSEFRSQLIIHMIEKVAAEEDLEMAYEWANYLEGDLQDQALKIVTREDAIIKRRQEERP
jgi:hypothetical protein